MKDLKNQKRSFHSNETYETCHLHCYMLICLLQFSILENMNRVHWRSREEKKQFTLPYS